MDPVKKQRSRVPVAGSFVSFPERFGGANDGVSYAPKVAVQVRRRKDSNHPLQIEVAINPHVILFDLQAVDADALSPDKIIRDCELIERAAERNPEALRTILSAFAEGAPPKRIVEAGRLAAELGLSEEASTKAGGGLLGLVVLGAAALLSGCFIETPEESEEEFWENYIDLSEIPTSPEEPDWP